MVKHWLLVGLSCVLLLALSGCSRQQSEWQKTRETNTADAYEQFLKKYPSGEFTAQAQAREKELYEERDWQKARDADTPEAYQSFLKQYPEGKWTEEARIRVENFTLAQAPSGSGVPSGPPAGGAVSAAASAAVPSKAAPASMSAAAVAGPRAAKSPSASGSATYGIQLGAFKSGPASASKRWARLKKTYPTLLAGLSPKVVPKKTAAGHLYRLQAIGLSEKHARELCRALKAKAQPCVVVPPAHG